MKYVIAYMIIEMWICEQVQIKQLYNTIRDVQVEFASWRLSGWLLACLYRWFRYSNLFGWVSPGRVRFHFAMFSFGVSVSSGLCFVCAFVCVLCAVNWSVACLFAACLRVCLLADQTNLAILMCKFQREREIY